MKRSLRGEYGNYLVELGAGNDDIVVLDADLKESTQSVRFQEKYPKRYIEVGVAEQNMVAMAAGMALGGKIPIAHSFACFMSMRACEQIRTTVAYPDLNVKLVASHAGISAGSAGATHHAIEDIAIMRSIPNMVVIAPGDVREMRQSIREAFDHNGPVYIRLSAVDVDDIFDGAHNFCLGKATQFGKGDDVSIITTGTMVHEGMAASKVLLKKFGIRARLIQMASIKPIDADSIVKAAKETGAIVTVEEHSVIGGFGSAVSEIVAETGKGVVTRIGIGDHFCGVGSYDCLKKKEGLTAENIVRAVLSSLKKVKKYA